MQKNKGSMYYKNDNDEIPDSKSYYILEAEELIKTPTESFQQEVWNQ